VIFPAGALNTKSIWQTCRQQQGTGAGKVLAWACIALPVTN